MTDRPFPILWPYRREEIAELQRLGCPRSVPWSLVEPHESQARSNHGGQSLRGLADRGGLSTAELAAVLEDRCWSKMSAFEMSHASSVSVVLKAIAAHARPALVDMRTDSDCLRCCIATVLGLSYEDVPDFVAERPTRWLGAMSEWLPRRGFAALRIQACDDGELLHSVFDNASPVTWIASGKAERGRNHAVVYRGDRMLHDPHPSRAGILNITAATVLVPKQ